MENTMKSRLIIAAGLLSMLGACVAGPDGPYGGTPAYYSGHNGGYYRNGYDSTYYNGRYDNDAHNHTYSYGRTY
jgi:hypothetical protein